MKPTLVNSLFLFCPIWLYFGLAIIFFAFPHYQTFLTIAILFLLAETHFGATFSIIFHKNWRQFSVSNEASDKEALIMLVIIPMLVILGLFFIFCINQDLAIGIFFIINIFHVTRQSSGILKILSNGHIDLLDSIFLWGANAICFLEIFRVFILHLDSSTNILIIYLCVMGTYFSGSLIFSKKQYKFLKLGCMLAGFLTFSPIFFTKNILAVMVLGVSMHYCQYLYLFFRIVEGRSRTVFFDRHTISNNVPKAVFFLLFFSSFITFISVGRESYGGLIFVPMAFQMYHFITDAMIWRGSIKSNRDNILRFIR